MSLAVLALLAGARGSASAAPQAATPVEVSPGVPGNGRAWELVTSEEPLSAFLQRQDGFLAPSGDRLFYLTLGKLPDAPMQEDATLTDSATRGGSGWDDTTLPRPSIQNDSQFVDAANTDLSEWIINGSIQSGGAHLLRLGPDGSSTEIANTGTSGKMAFIGASADLRRVYFSSSAHILPADAGRTSGSSIYESDATGTHLVDVDTGGEPLSTCGSEKVEASKASNGAVSSDGRRIYFTTHPGCSGAARVYLAEAGSSPTDISASHCDLPDCGPEADVELAAVTADGSDAYLSTSQRLTDEDTDSHVSLYRYDAVTGELTLLTPSSAEISAIRGVQVCEDGSKLYIRANGDKKVAEDRFVVDSSGLHELPAGFAGAERLQISSDGDVVAFATPTALVPTDPDSVSDVYRYDYRSEVFTLLSSGGTGERAATFEGEGMRLQAPLGGGFRAISADGSRIFFTTAEPLLLQDHNEAADVYEWHDGSLSLVSAGAGTDGSFLAGATPDGSSVFFSTGNTLLPRDRDGGNRDIYAARIGGGFPEPSPSGLCEGDACRNAISPPAPRPFTPSAVTEGRITVGPIGAAARRRIAATGWIVLLLEAPSSGRLQATAKARLGHRSRIVAETRLKVASPGPRRLRMRLSPPARARLAAGHGLRLRLLLRLGKDVPPKRVRIRLGGRR